MRRTGLALLLLALAIPTAQAALTKTLPYETTTPYLDSLDPSGSLTVTSGEIDAVAPQATGSFAVMDTAGFSIQGLTKVCWREGLIAPCRTGALSIAIQQHGSVGLCFPKPVAAALHADHVLALFVDLAPDQDLNTLPVVRSLVAPAVNGELKLSGIAAIPDAVVSNDPCSVSGAIAALDGNTTITLLNGDTVEKRFTGKSGVFVFAGQPVLPRVQATSMVMPFGAGSSADFDRAPRAAATEGLDPERLQDLVDVLDQSHSSSQTEREGNLSDSVAGLPGAVKRLLNGALVTIPGQAEGQEVNLTQLTFVRFTTMRVDASGGNLVFEGRALITVEEGRVEHTHNLIGVALVALPWWGIALWLIAITVWIVRLVLHPEKHSRWDGLRWIGWIATPLAVLLVFFLVDLEVRHLFGASVLAGSSGKAQAVFLLIDLSFMGLLGFMAAAPLRILLRNSFLLLRQGTFMGIAGSFAALLGFLFGYSYFRDYLDLVFSQVVSKLG